MDYQVIWAPSALQDLESVAAYVAQDYTQQAGNVGEEIIRHVDILHTFPRIGPVYERARDPRVHQVVCGSYRIFYRFREEQRAVDILHIWHSARSEPSL